MNIMHHRHSAMYIYKKADPVTDDYHADGSVVVVTNRDPQEAWLAHVDRMRAARSVHTLKGPLDFPADLGSADPVFEMHGNPPEQVHVFPRGCCCDR